jgi:hypothetical protein
MCLMAETVRRRMIHRAPELAGCADCRIKSPNDRAAFGASRGGR